MTVAVVVVGMGLTSAYDSVPLSYISRPGDRVAPSWSRPCWRRNAGDGSRYVLPCGRARGVILFRQGHDPDGDGDVHGVVQAGMRLVVIKSRSGSPRAARIPGVGHTVDLAGPVIPGKPGLTTLDVRRSAPSR